MTRLETTERSILIPEGVKVEVEGKHIKVTGPKGSLMKDLSHLNVNIKADGKNVTFSAHWPRKREIALVGTGAAHIRNMIKGVTESFTYKLKIVYAHFPMTVKILEKEKKVLIENFTGEKTSRIAEIDGNVTIKVLGDDVIVQGIDLEQVSQTAANIQAATKSKERDQRVFLDGIYVYEKSGGK